MAAAGLLPAARTHALREALEHFGKAAQQTQRSQLQIVYATHNDWNRANNAQHIAVLDASFNPPTRAHLALARLPRNATQPKVEYDAHILIFSVRNADKGRGRPGDATALQRLEMIELLAKQLECELPDPHVVVALVDEPLVFSKSTLIHAALGTQAPLYLYWLMGSDTITRVFQVKYYESEKHLEQNARSIPYKVILVIPPGPEPNPSQMRSINCYNGLGLLTNGTVKVPLSYGS